MTVCDHAQTKCPVFHGEVRLIHAGFDDPPTLSMGAYTEEEALDHYRRVRDEIKLFIESLPGNLI